MDTKIILLDYTSFLNNDLYKNNIEEFNRTLKENNYQIVGLINENKKDVILNSEAQFFVTFNDNVLKNHNLFIEKIKNCCNSSLSENYILLSDNQSLIYIFQMYGFKTYSVMDRMCVLKDEKQKIKTK